MVPATDQCPVSCASTISSQRQPLFGISAENLHPATPAVDTRHIGQQRIRQGLIQRQVRQVDIAAQHVSEFQAPLFIIDTLVFSFSRRATSASDSPMTEWKEFMMKGKPPAR